MTIEKERVNPKRPPLNVRAALSENLCSHFIRQCYVMCLAARVTRRGRLAWNTSDAMLTMLQHSLPTGQAPQKTKQLVCADGACPSFEQQASQSERSITQLMLQVLQSCVLGTSPSYGQCAALKRKEVPHIRKPSKGFFSRTKKGHKHKEFGQKPPPPRTHSQGNPDPGNSSCLGPLSLQNTGKRPT